LEGSSYEKILVVAALALFPSTTHQTPMGTQLAAVCFKTGEQISGMNKICYYDCLGSARAITIKATDLCPLTING
jgi:hypothetical protein